MIGLVELAASVDGLDRGRRVVALADSTMRDLRPAWPAVRRVLREAAMERFESEGGRDGAAWAPLSPEYARWKAARYPGRGILELTGELMVSLIVEGADGSIDRETDTGLTWGTSVPWARFHQRGTGRMPRRAPLELTPRDVDNVATAVAQAVVTRIQEAAA